MHLTGKMAKKKNKKQFLYLIVFFYHSELRSVYFGGTKDEDINAPRTILYEALCEFHHFVYQF